MNQIIQDLKNKVAELEAEALKVEAEAKAAVKTEVEAIIAKLQALLGHL